MAEDDRNTGRELASLRATLRHLRGDRGCPWDREQSLDDIISYLIEESYELLHAEQHGDWDEVAEELGDVMFLLVFAHELFREQCNTPLSEIIAGAHRKIVNRHPHVFGSTTARDSVESTAHWWRIKREEKRKKTKERCIEPPAAHLPPLRKARMIQKRAAEFGFDWPDHHGIMDKFREELDELDEAISSGQYQRPKEELGDLLFTVVNLARRLDIDPASALEATSAKFVKRFKEMERKAQEAGNKLEDMELEEMEKLWQQSKGDP